MVLVTTCDANTTKIGKKQRFEPWGAGGGAIFHDKTEKY